MLPAPFQFLIALVAYAINQRMARRVDYLREEVRVLKEALAAATGKTRIDFNAEQRHRLALKGNELTAEERRAAAFMSRMRKRNGRSIAIGSFAPKTAMPAPPVKTKGSGFTTPGPGGRRRARLEVSESAR